ncbi:MAG: hypothetical protein PHT89_02345 [Lachnospiraceae bacterium]|nr:hypothetical protein [Lachnospiraceae bacterium]MDD3659540.1 hypothetical protein [Lachnospiraceae bacterium]
MNLINKMERKWGKYAIHNLSLYLIICYGFGYAISFVNSDFLNYLTLNPSAILHGQVWRILTWLIVPPSGFSIFTVIMLFFYYSLGTALERAWGAFYYNLYIFSGMLFTVIGSFLLFVSCEAGILGGAELALYGNDFYSMAAYYFSTYYVNMSIFLAFASTFPDIQVLLMFVIPVKVKWLGMIYGVMLVYDFFAGNYIIRFVIAASLLNYLVTFLLRKNLSHLSPKQIKRRTEYKREVRRASSVTKHKCAICGRTDETNPELEFRFCSKCEGNYEYCQDHLFTHEHVKKS